MNRSIAVSESVCLCLSVYKFANEPPVYMWRRKLSVYCSLKMPSSTENAQSLLLSLTLSLTANRIQSVIWVIGSGYFKLSV